MKLTPQAFGQKPLMCSNLRSLFIDFQAFHFDRDDVALPGFHKFMLKQSEEEREHASKVFYAGIFVLESYVS